MRPKRRWQLNQESSGLLIGEVAHARRPQCLGKSPLQFADLVTPTVRHGAIGAHRVVRAIIVLDIEGLALCAPIAGILDLKAGAGQARSGLNRRGTCRARGRKESRLRPTAAMGAKVLRGVGHVFHLHINSHHTMAHRARCCRYRRAPDTRFHAMGWNTLPEAAKPIAHAKQGQGYPLSQK